jgi:GT2 family glycosyltransferase
VELAHGEVLAFTDADCLPHPQWLASGIACLQRQPACGFVGGNVEVFPSDPHRPTAVELFDMVFGLDQRINIERTKFAVTANLFTRRETFDRVGRFDDSLKSGGDADWGQRATAMGLPGRFCEEALVRHPARRSRDELIRQIRRHAGGRFDRHRRDPYRYFSLHFWRTLVNGLLPDVRRMARARRPLKERGYGFLSWARVAGVILIVQYARMGEFVRKWLGAESERT